MSIIQETFQKIHVQLKSPLIWSDTIFLLLLIAYVLSGVSMVPFHGDESAYLILSEDYDQVVKEQDFEKILFDPNGNPKQYLRLSTGGILSFSIGFVRDITNNDESINKWLWGSSWEDNVAMGNMPSPQLLSLARACSAVMGALGIVLFFFLARSLFSSRLAAWLAALALATQGSILMSIRRAMQEGPKFLFLILTAYIAACILKNLLQRELPRSLYFLLGVASGLTLAAKQDTAPMLVAIYLALAFIPVWNKGTVRTIVVNILYLGAATLLAYAFFLAFMPVFWRWWESMFVLTGFAVILLQLPLLRNDQTAKVLAFAGCALIIAMTILSPVLWTQLPTPLISMLQTRDTIVSSQLAVLADQNLFDPATTRNRLGFLLESTITSRVMYMEVSSFDVPQVQEQIKAYEASFLSGRTGSLFWDGFIALLACIGGWVLFRKFSAESFFVNCLLFISGVLLFFMIPLSWQRYFLILQIPYLLLAGVGGNQIWMWIKRFLVLMRHPNETAS